MLVVYLPRECYTALELEKPIQCFHYNSVTQCCYFSQELPYFLLTWMESGLSEEYDNTLETVGSAEVEEYSSTMGKTYRI